MNCLHCGQDVPQTEGKKARQYCNNAHRMAHKRTVGKVKCEQLIPDSRIPSAVVRPRVERDGSKSDKDSAIIASMIALAKLDGGWPASQWYAEQFYRLTHWSLAKLQEAGHWIPVWREALG